ncbi:hypothetical protein EG812_27940 [Verrucosispora sp. FIM060022]|nr:hypothetical protein EG812_27940 [Verrucosispora sp. FIM060022]
MAPLWIVVAALVAAALGILANAVSGWLPKPQGITTGQVVVVLVLIAAAIAYVALAADGKAPWPKAGSAPTAAPESPALSPPATPMPKPATSSTSSPARTAASKGSTPPRTPARATTTATKSTNLTNVDLGGSISPYTVRNDGRVKTLSVTIARATPNGKVRWQFGTLVDGDRPGCTVNDSVLCNDMFGGGTAVADDKGMAEFAIRWSPGDAYDTHGDAYDDAGWVVEVVDESTYGSSQRSCRCISVAFMVETASGAPPPSEWQH